MFLDVTLRHFHTKRGDCSAQARDELLKDLDHIRPCWHQLNASVAPKLHAMISHLPRARQLLNEGFEKLEVSMIEASHQSMTRDNQALLRAKDEDRVDKFEAKLQNTRVIKDINKFQRDLCDFARRKLAAETLALKKRRQMQKIRTKVPKKNAINEESKATDASTRSQTTKKRKLTSIVRHSS